MLFQRTIDSELFGHEKGAFLGLHLPEAGILKSPMAEQYSLTSRWAALINPSKIIKGIRDRRIFKVGSSKTQTTNVRIVAATNVNMRDAIQKINLEKTFIIDYTVRLSSTIEK